MLGRNFRSRAEILTAAARCIAHNAQRHPKALSRSRGAGGRITTRGFAHDRDEAAWAAGLIADALAAGTPPGEILVLARTAFATGPIQAALAAAGIPHRVLGSLGLYERAEVRDALAYLALLANPRDAQAFRRAVQAPRRGVGTATIAHVVAAARERFAGDLITASAHAHELTGVRSQPTRDAARRVRRRARRGARAVPRRALARPRRRRHRSRSTAASSPTTRRAATARRAPSERRDGERVLEDLRSLCRAAQAFADQVGTGASLTGFLEHAAGLHAAGDPPRRGPPHHRLHHPPRQGHRSRGSCCCSAARSSCCRPGARCRAADPEDLEEERRLFYVAATRAKDHLVLTRCHVRGGRATAGPSRFLAEAGLDIAPARARRLTHPLPLQGAST